MSFARNSRSADTRATKSTNKKYMQFTSVFLFSMLIGSLLAASSSSALAATTTVAETLQLAVTSIAPKLPANGETYPLMIQLQTVKDSHPIEAPTDIAITMLTSDETVASAQNEIVMHKGESLVKAPLTTTKKAGVVEMTAVSQGIKSGVADIETIAFGSLDPTKLALYTSSGSFISDPAHPGKMYVQLLNSGGIPAATNLTLTVFLSSGDVRVGTVPKTVTIQKGTTGTTFDFTATNQIGKTTVTASTNGLAPAEISVKTSGAVGNQLVVEFAPPSMPAPVGFNSLFTVQLRDADGDPVLAKQSITVNLSSSDVSIAKVPLSVTIEQGHSYASGKIDSQGSIGSASITASSAGFSSGSSPISTFNYVQASDNAQKKINVYTVPTQIVANNDEKALVIIQVTDTLGNVYTSKSYLYYPILVSSSPGDLGNVEDNLVPDITYATTEFKSAFLQGESTISASASDYVPGSATTTLSGSVPASLQITQIPGILLANNNNAGSAIVSLLDEQGKPTLASRDVLVSLSSSNPEILSVGPTGFIPAGKSYGQIQVHSTTKAGKATITAQAPGLAPISAEFKTVGNTGDSSQYKIGISSIPKLPADGRTYDSVFVQLQDSNENPVSALFDTRVVLSSSSMSAGTVDEQLTIKKGSSYGIAKFTTTLTASTFKITASSVGFGTVETDKQETTLQPLIIALPSTLPSKGQFGMNIPVAVDVLTLDTTPVTNATVQIGGRAANVTTATTDTNGHAESSYLPTLPGLNSITITVTKPGYDTKTANYPILLDQTVSIQFDAKTQGGKSVQLQAKISGPSGSKTLNSGSGAIGHANNLKWGNYKVSVPEQFSTADSQYTFMQWSDGVKESTRTTNVINDSTFTAVYSVKYLVTVSSKHGITSGGGYYSEGEKATVSINPTASGSFLVQSVFNGWTGDVRSGTATTQLVVDSPKTMTAEWNDNYLVLFVLIGAAGAGCVVIFFKIIKPRREAKARERAPDLDWYKS